VGDLGRAIAHYGGFAHRGFRITHLFDADPAKIGQQVGDIEIAAINTMGDTIKAAGIMVAMIATPAEAAQDVADVLVKAGVRAILNYAPIVVGVPEGVFIQYIDPVIHLQRMTYYLEE
jgi:redox-sensing transcriptional repressor